MSTPFDTLTDRTARDIEAAMLALRSARMFRDWPPGVLETLACEAQLRQPARLSTVTRPGT